MHGPHDLHPGIGDPVKQQVGTADQIAQARADVVAGRAHLGMIDQVVGRFVQPVENSIGGLRVVLRETTRVMGSGEGFASAGLGLDVVHGHTGLTGAAGDAFVPHLAQKAAGLPLPKGLPDHLAGGGVVAAFDRFLQEVRVLVGQGNADLLGHVQILLTPEVGNIRTKCKLTKGLNPMRNYIQPGNTITLMAPYDVTSGGGLLVGAIFGVAGVAITKRASGAMPSTVFQFMRLP